MKRLKTFLRMTIVIFVLTGCATAFSDVSPYGHSVYSSSNPANMVQESSSQCLRAESIRTHMTHAAYGINFDQTPTIESFCDVFRKKYQRYQQCYADCETKFAELFNQKKMEKEQREIDDRMRRERIAEKKRAEEMAIQEEEQKIAKFHEDLRSGKIEPTDIDQAKIAYDAGDGYAVAKAPKLRPDGQLYALRGSISAAEDGTAVFFGEVATWSNSLIPIKEFNYVGVRIPKELQDHYFDNARINGWFGIVGRYVDNSSYKNILGSSQTIPVFDAVYLELER